ncbi:MAG: metal-sensitive transcriptional regulator [Patescibacteria group bacterium]|jgi:DNA-binding FrmR family transcriptional regulator
MKKESSPKQDVVRRLKIVNGHIKKIIEMVENNFYCIDILQQTAAVKSAVKKAEEVLLKNHINHCVVRAINTNGKEKAINELMQVFKKTN